MSGTGQAVDQIPFSKMESIPKTQQDNRRAECCNPLRNLGAASLEHVMLALRETKEERELRIQCLFNFFDAMNSEHLDNSHIARGLQALRISAEYKYAKDLLEVCDSNQDGRVEYQGFPHRYWRASNYS